MSSRDIKFSEFMPQTRQLLITALKMAMTDVYDAPVMFNYYGDRATPTVSESMHAGELLRTTLTSETIYWGTENLIADALRYVVVDMENWIDGRDDDQTEAGAREEYTVRFGMSVQATTLTELKCLARSIAPHADICGTRILPEDENDAAFQDFTEAFYRQIDTTDGPDYGQHCVGIVVDNIMFELSADHPVIQQLQTVLQRYFKVS